MKIYRFIWPCLYRYVPILEFIYASFNNLQLLSAIKLESTNIADYKRKCSSFYSQGGLKAAILSDVIQGVTMIGVSLVIIAKGSADIGPDKILNVTYERGRLDFFK